MRLAVDGADIEVPDGASILDATRAAGADVPTLCHDDRLTPTGDCRICLVHVDGIGLAAACVTPATDGMRVETGRPEVVDTARHVLQLMIDRLPATALHRPTQLAAVCERLAVLGADTVGRGLEPDASHPYVHYDPNLCVSCGRCVRMCDEVQGTFALTMVGRGADTLAAPGPGTWAESACVACGGCVDSCPSGAITGPVPLRAPSTIVRTTCGYCGVGCGLNVHTERGHIDAITPDLSGPVNRGHACVKGRFAGTMTRRTSNLTLLPRETLDIHPDDAARLSVHDGQTVRVSSPRGTITAHARLTDDVAPGHLFMAFHFPDTPTNVLTSPYTDEVTSCPEYKVTAVSLEPDHLGDPSHRAPG
jgi:formate dehydrogenase major subunit